MKHNIIYILLYAFNILFSQYIYTVGDFAGSSKACYSSGATVLNIYSVGINDGFAKYCYSQAVSNLDIYTVGIDDGFAKDCYSSGVSTLDIYSVGSDMGSSFNCVTDVPLPVTWLSFNGFVLDNNVILEWSTATEINNDYFLLQRSIDTKTWETLASIKGRGNSDEVNVYTYTDSYPYDGVNYYKLIQVDFDGNFEDSKLVSAKFSSYNNLKISVYPNPVKDILFVKGLKQEAVISIFDVNGVLQSETLNTTINVANLGKGFYFLRISTSKNTNYVFKFVKQ